jgi:protein-S-isoprenylcysteine O-methyltransferase Ste14
MKKERDVAGVITFPPLIYAVPLAAGIIAERLLTQKRLSPVLQPLSIGFFAAAVALVAPAFAQFKKAGTTADVFEESTALVESGPFEYTRNPLYFGLTLTYIGIAFAARARLPLFLLPAALWLINTGVIDREERYLERKFGKAYRKYLRRVPRWL